MRSFILLLWLVDKHEIFLLRTNFGIDSARISFGWLSGYLYFPSVSFPSHAVRVLRFPDTYIYVVEVIFVL